MSAQTFNHQDIDPSKISMMMVQNFKPQTPNERKNQVADFSHVSYSLSYPNFPFVSIDADTADTKIKAWRKQGIPYRVCKLYLFCELMQDHLTKN